MPTKPRSGAKRKIISQEDFEKWLSVDKSADPAIVFRMALRLLPLTCTMDLPDEASLSLALQVFRAAFVVWAAQNYSLKIGRSAAKVAAEAISAARSDLVRKQDPSVADAAAYVVEHMAAAYSRSGLRSTSRAFVSSLGLGGAEYAIRNVADMSEARTFWNSAAVDSIWIEGQIESRQELILEPLWFENVRRGTNFRLNFPIWARVRWDSFKRSRAARAAGFDIWIRWYEAALSGRQEKFLDKGLTGSAEREIIFRIVESPPEFWRRPPGEINAEVKAWIEEIKASVQKASPPQVPKTRPAAIEPLWQNGKLTLPIVSLPSDIDEASLLAALDALREDLSELADDAIGIANIDHRPAEYLRRLADRIPNAMPSQALLFRLGHANEVLNDLARATDEEWPELLAARYRRLALQYERAVRQFPKWRAFVRNASEQDLTAEQLAGVPEIVDTVIAELQTEDAQEFIDPEIPNALKATQAPIVDWKESIDTGNEQLAEDLLESVNNILKRTVEFSLALKSAGIDPVIAWTGTTAKKSIEEFGREAEKSIVKEFGKFGKSAGPALGRFLRRIAKATTRVAVPGAGSALLFQRLFTLYPDSFSWLEPILRFLHLI